MAVDRRLEVAGWSEFFEGAIQLSDLAPRGRRPSKRDVGILITELLRFADCPSKEGAKVCRALINELQSLAAKDNLLSEFLDGAYQTVARPYRKAPADIKRLIGSLAVSLAKKNRRVTK